MSMPFHRTPEGLSNHAIFAKVDAVVFAEGGKQLSVEDIERGLGDKLSLDAAFWSSVIRSSAPDKKVEVRSIGNKMTAEAIARLVAAGLVTRVIVAVDRDFDDRRGRLIRHRNIFHTYGYSWENDVYCEEVLIDLIGSLGASDEMLTRARIMLSEASDEIRRCFARVVRLDHALALDGKQLTLRGELDRAIRVFDNDRPTVDRSVIAAELMRCRSLKCRMGPELCACVETDLCGHVVEKWWFFQIRNFLRTHLTLAIKRDLMARLAISAFARRGDGQSRDHYRTMIARTAW